jgi:hypothetical protein
MTMENYLGLFIFRIRATDGRVQPVMGQHGGDGSQGEAQADEEA